MSSQISQARRVLRQMNDVADTAADRQAGPAGKQLRAARRVFDQMNDASDRAADSQVARSTPNMSPK